VQSCGGTVCGVGPVRVAVVFGVSGRSWEGVKRLFKDVGRGSSIRLREERRKLRSVVLEKQNCGVKCGRGVGCDIVRTGGLEIIRGELRRCERREGGGEGVVSGGLEEVVQNHASVSVDGVFS
jgi:hypothetical protein